MTNYDEIEAMLMSEAFDENSEYSLPVVNLNTKQNPAQTLAIQTPSDEDGKVSALVVKLASATELGEKIVNLKMSDKTMQVVLFSLSDKGNFAELKNGLGGDPFAAINTIIEIVKERVKEQRLESVMFRFPTKKMKGRGPQVQRIVSMIAKRRLPTFETLDEIKDVSAKHSYVVLYKKSTGLESKGLPAPNPERFEKVETKVGEKYMDKSTGQAASKAEAIAVTIADKVDKTVNDKAMIAKLKVSRRAAILAQGTGMFKAADNMTPTNLKKLDKIMLTPPVDKGDKTASQKVVEFQAELNDTIKSNVEYALVKSREDFDYNDWFRSHITSSVDKFHSFDTEGPHGAFSGRFGNSLIDIGMTDDVLRTELAAMTTKIDDEIKKLNATNADEVLKSILYEITSSTAYKKEDDYNRTQLLRVFTNWFVETIADPSYASAYRRISGVKDNFTPAQRTAISQYCGQFYRSINNFLLGREDPTPTALKHISEMDKAFEHGMTLPKGIKLYRGQLISFNEMKQAAESKLFYFRNYVSTSLKPIIFEGSFGASTSASLDAQAPNTDTNSVEDVLTAGRAISTYVQNGESKQTDDRATNSVGFIIKGADAIKTIVPTKELSNLPNECEVILPRGTVLRLNRITGSGEITDENRTYLIDSTIVPPEQIDETVEVYDGDLFMSEGIIEPMKPRTGLFAEMYSNSKEERKDAEWSVLASVVNISNMAEKFVL